MERRVSEMRTKTVSARVEMEFYERVQALAERRGVTVSYVVREALEKELSENRRPWWRFW